MSLLQHFTDVTQTGEASQEMTQLCDKMPEQVAQTLNDLLSDHQRYNQLCRLPWPYVKQLLVEANIRLVDRMAAFNGEQLATIVNNLYNTDDNPLKNLRAEIDCQDPEQPQPNNR